MTHTRGRVTAIFSGFSEFGRALAGFLAAEPAARGAVLSDGEGDAIDFAYDPSRTTDLEVQLLGAQLDRAAARVAGWCTNQGRGACEILIEASHGRLCCAHVDTAYVLAALLDPSRGDDARGAADAERLLAGFRAVRRQIEALLRG